MKRVILILISLAAMTAGAGSLALGQEEPAAGPLAGSYDPADLVEARRALKSQVYAMQQEIEFGVEDGAEDQLANYSQDLLAIAATLEAFPYLFPQSTSPDALAAAGSQADTDAAPAIWEDFPAFFDRAEEVAALAREAAAVETFEAVAEASSAVWTACTSCHDDYLNYEMDLNFGGESGLDLDNLGFN